MKGFTQIPVTSKERRVKAHERIAEAKHNGEYVQTSDYQKQRVYDAETMMIRNGFVPEWHDTQHLSFEEMEDATNRLFSLPEVTEEWGMQEEVFCIRGRGGNHAWCRPAERTICYPNGQRYKYTVVHESAHLLSTLGEWHGVYFTRTLLKLVEIVYGMETKDELLRCYYRNGVHY